MTSTRLRSIAQSVQAATAVEADSWIKTNAQFFTAVNAQQNSNTLIRVFVGMSVAFGIASVLVVSVIQRAKDIGILRAMGATQGQILRVFLLQGGLLGLAGSIIGAATGGFGTGILARLVAPAGRQGALSAHPATLAVRDRGAPCRGHRRRRGGRAGAARRAP